MKKLITTDISSTAKMPVEKVTMDLLQAAHIETTKAAMISAIGDNYNPNLLYRIWGAVWSFVGATQSITEGAFFYNGEIYFCPAQSTTFAVFSGYQINTAYLDTDSVSGTLFTDGSYHQIHQVKTIKLVDTNVSVLNGPYDIPRWNFYSTTVATFGAGVGYEIVIFNKNENRYFTTALTGTATATVQLGATSLSAYNMIPGTKVRLFIPINGTITFAFSNLVSGTTWIFPLGTPIITDTGNVHCIECEYVGVLNSTPTFTARVD